MSRRGAMEILRGSWKEMGRGTKNMKIILSLLHPHFPSNHYSTLSKDTKVSCFDGGGGVEEVTKTNKKTPHSQVYFPESVIKV